MKFDSNPLDDNPDPQPGNLRTWLAEFHAGHDCKPGRCQCRCGCQVEMGCTIMGGLCSVCHVRSMRDGSDGEHGFLNENEAGQVAALKQKLAAIRAKLEVIFNGDGEPEWRAIMQDALIEVWEMTTP